MWCQGKKHHTDTPIMSMMHMTDCHHLYRLSKITYSYDINDNIISTKYPKKLSPVKELRYTYNLDNWLVAVTMVISTTSGDKSTKLREYEYNNMGELREVKEYTNPLNCTNEYTSEKYQYDAFGRITAIKYIENSTKKVRESYEYTYDKSSNITKSLQKKQFFSFSFQFLHLLIDVNAGDTFLIGILTQKGAG